MKNLLIGICIILSYNSVLSQNVFVHGKFPVLKNNYIPVQTSELLKELNWTQLKLFCETAKGHYVDSNTSSRLKYFHYQTQGLDDRFSITSYKNLVLEFDCEISDEGGTPFNTDYFDKNLFMRYAKDILPNLSDSFNITVNQPKDVLVAYYKLLGLAVNDEYGWICEYSTVGMAPGKRNAIVDLIRYDRLDLLRKLIQYSNPQTQLYSADAMVYFDFKYRKVFNQYDSLLTSQTLSMNSFLLDPVINKYAIDSLKHEIQNTQESLNYLKMKLLNSVDWDNIYALRDSNKIIITCENSGSYKNYTSTTQELLSKEAILDIPNKYEIIKSTRIFNVNPL